MKFPLACAHSSDQLAVRAPTPAGRRLVLQQQLPAIPSAAASPAVAANRDGAHRRGNRPPAAPVPAPAPTLGVVGTSFQATPQHSANSSGCMSDSALECISTVEGWTPEQCKTVLLAAAKAGFIGSGFLCHFAPSQLLTVYGSATPHM